MCTREKSSQEGPSDIPEASCLHSIQGPSAPRRRKGRTSWENDVVGRRSIMLQEEDTPMRPFSEGPYPTAQTCVLYGDCGFHFKASLHASLPIISRSLHVCRVGIRYLEFTSAFVCRFFPACSLLMDLPAALDPGRRGDGYASLWNVALTVWTGLGSLRA